MSRKPKIDRRGAPKKDLPGLYEWPLDPAEWDFRHVPPDEINVATYYEYAASCDWIRLLWKTWLTKQLPSWKTLRLAPGLQQPERSIEKTRPVSDILTEHCRDGIPRVSTKGYTAEVEDLVASIPQPLRDHEFSDILFAVPAFPTPWLKLDEQSKARLKKLFNWPRWNDSAFSVFDPSEPVAAYRQNPGYKDRIFEVVLDWTKTEPDILEAFQNWLTPKYKLFGHQPKPKGKQGMASSDGYERLRWLTAWRLHRSGLKHEAAQEVLEKRNRNPHSKYIDHDLPMVPDEGSWRNFHTKARKVCGELFPYPPDNL